MSGSPRVFANSASLSGEQQKTTADDQPAREEDEGVRIGWGLTGEERGEEPEGRRVEGRRCQRRDDDSVGARALGMMLVKQKLRIENPT